MQKNQHFCLLIRLIDERQKKGMQRMNAMTANAFAEDVQVAKTVGINEHIAKPLELKILIKTMKRWLG